MHACLRIGVYKTQKHVYRENREMCVWLWEIKVVWVNSRLLCVCMWLGWKVIARLLPPCHPDHYDPLAAYKPSRCARKGEAAFLLKCEQKLELFLHIPAQDNIRAHFTSSYRLTLTPRSKGLLKAHNVTPLFTTGQSEMVSATVQMTW